MCIKPAQLPLSPKKPTNPAAQFVCPTFLPSLSHLDLRLLFRQAVCSHCCRFAEQLHAWIDPPELVLLHSYDEGTD
jgi:hypothetical protein